MSVPAGMLPQTVVDVQPATTTDSYGNTVYDYGDAAVRRQVAAWLQQDQRTEVVADGADPLRSRWLLVTDDCEIGRRDRIEWEHPSGETITFTVDGAPEPVYTPAGYHHTEITLRVVQ